jgi:hypothetical protein
LYRWSLLLLQGLLLHACRMDCWQWQYLLGCRWQLLLLHLCQLAYLLLCGKLLHLPCVHSPWMHRCCRLYT